MPASRETPIASATAEMRGDVLEVALAGNWQITEARPSWRKLLADLRPKRILLTATDVEKWDSSLALFVWEVQQWCRVEGIYCDDAAVPEKMRRLVAQLATAEATSVPFDRSTSFLSAVGVATTDTWAKARDLSRFVGEVILGAVQLFHVPRRFRWKDCIREMQQCGAMALPIVSLISFLVGVTLAYTGAIVLRQYGGDIYIADLIGLAMVRETGAVMTAVVLAGRTGAAFAATLGNMKANEEIDALETLGISPIQFLVLPRMLALAIMMPLLTMYANALGIIGGMVVALSLLAIPPTAYFVEMQSMVDMSDMMVGLIKGGTFGIIVGLAGCLRGLQAERSAAGVGNAATSAVVTALLLLVVVDAIFAVLFNALGW